MSTPQLHIEFAHLDGTTQVAIFDALPTWATLAARVQTLFDIPETAAALAYVDADGDEITIDAEKRVIDTTISEEEFARRKAAWKAPEARYKKGTLTKYAKLVTDASSGCVTDNA